MRLSFSLRRASMAAMTSGTGVRSELGSINRPRAGGTKGAPVSLPLIPRGTVSTRPPRRRNWSISCSRWARISAFVITLFTLMVNSIWQLLIVKRPSIALATRNYSALLAAICERNSAPGPTVCKLTLPSAIVIPMLAKSASKAGNWVESLTSRNRGWNSSSLFCLS